MHYETLPEAIAARANRAPQELALVFIAEDGTEENVPAGQFHEQALAFAYALQHKGVQRGDVVVLVLRHSTALLYAFWGALYLGAVPSIFPFMTEKLDPAIYSRQVRAMVAHARARTVVTFPEFRRDLARLLEDEPYQVLDVDELDAIPEDTTTQLQWSGASPEATAFLQHSSGTTGLQKGVALSHRAVLNQIRAYSEAIDLQPDDVVVSWLPLYHDMGLIAGFVMPLVAGVPLVLFSPFHWVRNPVMLFRGLHRHRGTLCWLPNFAYNHCVRAVRKRDLQGLDLRRWRMAINCSEPVRHDSHQQFLDRFAPFGLRAGALATCYAMAENTFAVTQSVPGQEAHVDWLDRKALQTKGRATPQEAGSDAATPVVSCGYPISGTEIMVVDEAGRAVGERTVGEIFVRSNCMMDGYYRRPDLAREAFSGDWYRSGDMGYLAEGQLYITGRKKDLIINGGKNIYPQDVEALAASVAGVYPGRAVAFGLPDERLGTEGIVLVCELNGDGDVAWRKEIEIALRQRVLHVLGVTLSDVRLVQQRWLLKTSSGKIARFLNRDRYLQEFRS